PSMKKRRVLFSDPGPLRRRTLLKNPDSVLTLSLTRRKMLQATTGLGVALMLDKSGLALTPGKTGPLSLDLGGDMWALREEGKGGKTPASIPGSTYTNLLAAGTIPDPFFGANNTKVQWVGEKSWSFERSFNASSELGNKRHVELVCHGLDTLATVWLNGHEIGNANNMFRKWTFDIKPHLHKGANHIRIRFDPLTAYVEGQRSAYKNKYGVDLSNERSWVRKAP